MSKIEDKGWLAFEYSIALEAWIITVDKDARITIEEIAEVVRNDPFLVRVNEGSVN